MADKHLVTSELSRELTLFEITMMGLGMMIGAGVFLGIGNAIGIAGPGGVILTFVLNGVIAIMTACSYAELSSAVPYAGGAYNYTRIGFGRGASYLAGWMEWYASSVAGSLYAVTFSIYLIRYLQLIGCLEWLPVSLAIAEKGLAVIIALSFLYINYRGASETGKVGAFFTFGQTLFLVIIGIIGFIVVIRDPSRLQNFKPFLPNGWSKLLITMGFTYVAFEGFEVIAQTGDEAIQPRRNLPKAMIYSVCIVTFTYAAVSFAAMVAVKAGSSGVDAPPWQWIGQFHERGFGEAIARLLPMGNLLLTLAIIFASTSALNATIYSATRVMYAMGRDQMLPSFFSRISKKQKTPWVALIATGALVIIVATVLPTLDVASSASMMFLLLFFLVNLCVVRVRYHMQDELTYGFLMPFFPYLPVIAIVCQIILAVWLIHMSFVAWIIAPAWIICGTIIYLLYSRTHTKTTVEEVQIIEEEEVVPDKPSYRIMAAVANPENALGILQITRKLSQAKMAHLELIHMVPVPDQMPLADADQYIWEGKEAIIEVLLYMKSVPVGTTIRYCRNIARGIVSAIREKKINLLIMGWHGNHHSYIFRLGSTVDPVIERAPCHVIIVKNACKKQYNKILVPVSGGPNSGFALEMASFLIQKEGGKITLFTVTTEKHEFSIKEFVHEHQKRLNIADKIIEIRQMNETNVARCILQESGAHDLVVIGYTQQPLIQQVTHPTIPDIVARECQTPLIIAKGTERFESWFRRWI
ncbi:amino acid permease [bacterium]|nr:amino acid permease [bacterium]RQV98257.1 MAG: amino acid permease [bacterium]